MIFVLSYKGAWNFIPVLEETISMDCHSNDIMMKSQKDFEFAINLVVNIQQGSELGKWIYAAERALYQMALFQKEIWFLCVQLPCHYEYTSKGRISPVLEHLLFFVLFFLARSATFEMVLSRGVVSLLWEITLDWSNWLLLHTGPLIKEMLLPLGRKFFPLKLAPIVEWIHVSGSKLPVWKKR